MEEILVIALQFIAEIFIDVLASLPSWPSGRRQRPESERIILFSILWCVTGGFIGWLSALALPAFFLHDPSLRMANLVIAPLVSAALGYALARWRWRTNLNIRPFDHLWYSFFFTLAFVGVRYAYAAVA